MCVRVDFMDIYFFMRGLEIITSQSGSLSRSVLYDSVIPDCIVTQLLCPRNSSAKNARLGTHFDSRSDPGIEPGCPALQADSLSFEPQWKPKLTN